MEKGIAYILSFLVMTVIAGAPSTMVRKETSSKWANCVKPAISPPNYVFPIVWTVLYTMIAISFAEVLSLPKTLLEKPFLLGMFMFHLVLNMSWSFIYFGYKQIFAAFVVIILMIFTLGILLRKIQQTMPIWNYWLLVPYALWLCFALLLNGLSFLRNQKMKCSKYA